MPRGKGHTRGDVGAATGANAKTACGRLRRPAEGGACRIYDTPGPRRPCRLGDGEGRRPYPAVRNGPESAGCGRGDWTSGTPAGHAGGETGQTCSGSGMPKTAPRTGCPRRVPRPVPRPVPCSPAAPEGREIFWEGTGRRTDGHRGAGYKTCRRDACAMGGFTRRPAGHACGGRRDGGRRLFQEHMRILGVSGEDAPGAVFGRTYKSEDAVRVMGRACKEHEKPYTLPYSAGSDSGAKAGNRVGDVNGGAVPSAACRTPPGWTRRGRSGRS